MKPLNNKLSEIFDIQPIPQKAPAVIEEENQEFNASVEKDFDHARTNIKNLITKGDTAIDQLILIADESEQPRAYEVVANLIKTMAELNKDLLTIQKVRKELTNKGFTNDNKAITVDKAVFVGSTKDLITMIKNNKEENGTTN